MIAHGKDIKVITGNSNPLLARDICKELGIPLGNSEVGCFSDGENYVSIYETVRGSDVFVVQSTCSFVKDGQLNTVNDALMELLIIIDALKRASAGRITAVIPYFGYARQDRKTKPRDPISAKLVANLITTAGADRVLTMDLHANQIQGFFDIPVDNMLGSPIFVDYFNRKFKDDHEDTMVVSPDVGSVARARAFAQKLNMPLAIVDKRRQKANSSEVMNIIGDVRDKRVILVDDSVVRGTTCARLIKLVRDAGAEEVHLRVSAPPFRYPCFFGVDIPDQESLLAHNRTVEEMRQIVGADTLGFLSVEALRNIARDCKLGFCDACFTGKYPMEVPAQGAKNIFESEIDT